MALFILYFHDIIIHRRIKVKYKFSSTYINRLIRAHKIHHKHLGRKGSEAFGFLYANPKYKVKKTIVIWKIEEKALQSLILKAEEQKGKVINQNI